MAKHRILSGRDVCRILGANGFAEVRRKGSHIVMQRRNASGTQTTIVPDHESLKPETLASIIRQSGLDRVLFQ